MATNIRFVSSPASSGKTFKALGYAAQRAARGAKFVIAQPSYLLLDQTAAGIKQRFPDVLVTPIHGNTAPGGVTAAIIQHTREAKAGAGEVLLVT